MHKLLFHRKKPRLTEKLSTLALGTVYSPPINTKLHRNTQHKFFNMLLVSESCNTGRPLLFSVFPTFYVNVVFVLFCCVLCMFC
jgi:hypothetical protein